MFCVLFIGRFITWFLSWNNRWKFVLPSWGALWYVPFLLCSNRFQLLNSASSRNWVLYCHSSQVLWHSKLGIKCPKAICYMTDSYLNVCSDGWYQNLQQAMILNLPQGFQIDMNIRMYVKRICHKDGFIYVVDLFSNCLFMIMKLLVCVMHPDWGRIRDGCLLLGQSQ